jgi:hypothetical protein
MSDFSLALLLGVAGFGLPACSFVLTLIAKWKVYHRGDTEIALSKVGQAGFIAAVGAATALWSVTTMTESLIWLTAGVPIAEMFRNAASQLVDG